MDVPFHEVAQRLINHSMPRHGVLAAEGFRNDGELPVAAPRRPRTGVARMLPAFVAQFQSDRREGGELVPHGGLDGVHHAGKAFLNGFTVTFAYTPAATYGSSAAQAIAASREAKSATMSDPVIPAGPGSAASIAGCGPARM